ncbi:hypothetical protein [Streptomyces formicae]|uniref:Uncharacterized protein n=1 Tax=Streptomyces formicae TaxID=1616117 RepID=A0ABY3WKP1_9ACTN|nr:hypothetical protein [Streptomyces formicae]UNM13184.1 hypothetical protein J4032_18310 [Streptomyces formicae]
MHPQGRTLVLDVLPTTFPWVRYLPAHDAREFSVDLVAALGAASEPDNTAAVAQPITEWKHTSDIHADPEPRSLPTPARTSGPCPSRGPQREPKRGDRAARARGSGTSASPTARQPRAGSI